jgi:HSP20 family protein
MALVRWQPRSLAAWDPFRELSDLRQEMNRLFDWTLGRTTGLVESGWFPPMDVVEKDDQVVVKMDLPGLTKQDVEVSLVNNVLTVRGERKQEEEKKDDNFYTCERVYGRFERTIELPVSVDPDKVEATFKNGVLEIRLPKTAESRTRQISIKD